MTAYWTLLVTSALVVTANCAIRWTPCNATEFNTTVIPFQYANLEVPLDYTNPDSGETLTLELLKAPPAVQSSKGSIIFNLGGPGAPNRHDFTELASELIP